MLDRIYDGHLRAQLKNKDISFGSNMEGLRVLFLFMVAFVGYSSQHSYGLGNCPSVTPMDNFDMRKLLGIWYVIRKTSTYSSCLTYNFTATNEPNKYHIQQDSHLFVPGEINYHYNGEITVPDTTIPAKMKVKFSLNLGSASYIVLTTDYHSYAAIFTCQAIPFGHRKSISILSRKNTLDRKNLEAVEDTLKTFYLNPDDLSIISQDGCEKLQTGRNITINEDTFSVENAAGIFRKAGDKIGDGLEYVASGAKKLYGEHAGDRTGDAEKIPTRFTVTNTNPDAEWIP